MDRPAIDSLLDLDFYKLTMGQFVYHRHPDIHVTYSLINRRSEQRLADKIKVRELQDQFNHICSLQFNTDEIEYLSSLQGSRTHEPLFQPDYLLFLQNDLRLPKPNVFLDKNTNEININVSGAWHHVVLWETLIMSTILELYIDK